MFDGCTPPSKIVFNKKTFLVHMHNFPIACMNEEMGKLIENAVGVVKECEVNKDGTTWGHSLRVYIELELQKPISRGRFLNVSGNKI